MSSAWLKSIRKGCDEISDIPGHSLDDITNTIKAGDSGVPSINNAINDLTFTQVGDEVHVGNARWRDVEPLFRKGDIDEAFDAMSVTHTISSADKALFKKSLADTSPDIKIDELESKTTVAKKYHSDLDVSSEATGDELAEKLTPSSKTKVKTFYDKLKKYAPPTLIGAGLFTSIIFGVEMWTGLNDAIAARNGCFIVKTSSGSTSCKVISHTCGFGTEGDTPCSTEVMETVKYNIRLMCLDITKDPPNTNAIDALTAKGITPVLSAATVDEVLNNTPNIPILVSFYPTYYTGGVTFDGCALSGLVNDCVACDTTAATNSIYYTNATELDGSETLKCIKDSTLLDTLVDVSTEMGVEIFDAVGDSISGSFSGNLFLMLFIIILVIGGVTMFLKFKKKKGLEPKNTKTSQTLTPMDVDSNSFKQPLDSKRTNQRFVGIQ